MSKTNNFLDYVNSLCKEDFNKFKQAIDTRIDIELYGVTSFEETTIKYGRKPVCPICGSTNYSLDGKSNANHIRYLCLDCNASYILLSNSIFNSSKISFHKLMNYISLMSFNVPHELISEILDIGANTTDLWRKKIFETVNNYQDHIKLYGQIFIDETYLEDYSVLAIKQDNKHLRCLSKTKICIVVAIDSYKNMVTIVSGHGKPSSKMITSALESHITPNATIIHDGGHSHYQLIKKLKLKEKVYKANIKDEYYLKNMTLINNMYACLKRYIWRFIGMDIDSFQSYLNLFIYS